MRLYLVQHGEAAAKDVDPERPLTSQGAKDVATLADFLHRAGVRVDRVIHSGKLRAQQTAELLAKAIGRGVPVEISDRINPNDDPAAIDWQHEGAGQDLLVVGHLPYIARLAALLVTKEPDAAVIACRPGSMVCLEHDGTGWSINWMLRPELLA